MGRIPLPWPASRWLVVIRGAKIPRLDDEADFEYLYRAGVMGKDEIAGVLALWILMLELHGEVIKTAIMDGEPRGYLAGLHRQAVLLGDPAPALLQQALWHG